MTDPRDPDPPTQRPQGRPSGAGKKALGKGLGALIGESRAALGRSGAAPALGEGRLRELPLADISVNRRQPRRTFSDDELRGAGRVHQGARRGAARRRAAAARGGAGRRRRAGAHRRPLRADRRRAPPARREARRPRVHPGAGAPGRRDLVARDRARRERRPRGPQRDRGGARLRGARRRVRPHARAHRRAGRPQPRLGHQPAAPARPARRGAGDDRARRPHGGTRARAARRCRTTASAAGSRGWS